MVSRESIGEFEQLVLLAILRLGDEAYGIPILDEITRQTGRKVLRPAVYVALRRLEEKGLITTRMGESTADRGRSRKYFRVAPAGLDRLRESRQALLNMWDGVHAVLDER